MDNVKIGRLIRDMRTEKKMTQLELANKLNVSDKTISKWERGQGMPDVSFVNEIAEIFGITAEKLLSGNLRENKYSGANLNRLHFLWCERCGNVITSTAESEISCCGRKLSPLKAEKNDSIIKNAEIVEDEYFITFDSPMTKSDFVTFVAVSSFDKFLFFRLYPEQNSEVRVPVAVRGKIFVGTNDGNLYVCGLGKFF